MYFEHFRLLDWALGLEVKPKIGLLALSSSSMCIIYFLFFETYTPHFGPYYAIGFRSNQNVDVVCIYLLRVTTVLLRCDVARRL